VNLRVLDAEDGYRDADGLDDWRFGERFVGKVAGPTLVQHLDDVLRSGGWKDFDKSVL